MASAARLNVPLDVDVGIGENWKEAKELTLRSRCRLMVRPGGRRPVLHRRRRHQGHVAHRRGRWRASDRASRRWPCWSSSRLAAPADDADVAGRASSTPRRWCFSSSPTSSPRRQTRSSCRTPRRSTSLLLSPLVLGERVRRADISSWRRWRPAWLAFFLGQEPPRETASESAAGRYGRRRQRRHLGGDDHRPALAGTRDADERRCRRSPRWWPATSWRVCAALPFALPVDRHHGRRLGDRRLSGRHPDRAGLCLLLDWHGRACRRIEASLLLLLEPVLNPVWSWLVHGEVPVGGR